MSSIDTADHSGVHGPHGPHGPPTHGDKKDPKEKAKEPKTRSRNGCLVCRARRVKCDQGKPECAKCIKSSAECVYPPKKVFDPQANALILQQRHKRKASSPLPYSPSNTRPAPYPLSGVHSTSSVDGSGSQLPHDPAGPSTGPLTHSSTPETTKGPAKLYDDSPASMDAIMALCRMTRMGSFFTAPREPPESLRMAIQNPDELRCLHHCLAYTLSILVINEEYNPWIQFVAPLFLFPAPDTSCPLSINALRFGMLATGATHLAYLYNRVQPTCSRDVELAEEYRAKSIAYLRQARTDINELTSDAFLSAVLMIVTNDVFGAIPVWREPWRYGVESVAARGGLQRMLFGDDPNSLPPFGVRALIEHWIALDTFVCQSSGERPSVVVPAGDWWARLGELAIGPDNKDTIELIAGLQRSMLRMYNTTLRLLADWRTLKRAGINAFWVEGDAVLRAPGDGGSMGSEAPGDATSHLLFGSLRNSIYALEHDLEQWRASASTVQFSSLDRRIQIGSWLFWHTCQILIKRDLRDYNILDHSLQSSARAVLDLCIEAGDKVEYLNWPLITACSVILDAVLREQAKGIIKIFAYQCGKELQVTSEVIEEIWRRRDEGRDKQSCHPLDVMMEIGKPMLLG